MIPKPPKTGIGAELEKEVKNLRDSLYNEITSPTQAQNEIKLKFDKSLKRTLKTFSLWLKTQIVKKYKEGATAAEEKTPKSKRIEFKQDNKYAQKKYINSYSQFAAAVSKAYSQSYKEIANKLARSKEKLVTYELRNKIDERLKEKGFLTVNYDNGAKIPTDAYAEMVARTTQQQAFNAGMIQYARQATDLVQCTTMSPTCNICAQYQGRIYSVSGNDKRYPALYETALADGYETIHPNCRHQFLPYYEEFDTEKEKREGIKESNAAFEDNRSAYNVREYKKWQALNAERRDRKNKRLYSE